MNLLFSRLLSRNVASARRNFTVLALESSADDTCAAVVTSDRRILSNVVIKQHHIHKAYGGIQPIEAIHEHQRNMPFAVKRALAEARVDIINDIDGIAFTRGPGMAGCLSVNCNAAKTLAITLNKPLVGVHHMQGHALIPILTTPDPPKFPFLTLLISGGHTLLLLATSNTDFKILATTVDEAIGRCIDRVARLLELKWKDDIGPGAALEQFVNADPHMDTFDIPAFPKPLSGKLAFSFAGFHSFTDIYVRSQGGIEMLDTAKRRRLARAFQASVFEYLEDKMLLGLNWCGTEGIKVQDIVVSGGVASNQSLREQLRMCLDSSPARQSIRLVFPPPNLCTDNAVMIGWASMNRFLAGDHDAYDIIPRPKWSIEHLSDNS